MYLHKLALTCFIAAAISVTASAQQPGPTDPHGYLLPNGWRITPFGKALETHDLILNIKPAPDGRAMVAVTCGFNPHELIVVDAATHQTTQRISLPTAWYGLAWNPDGTKLYVSGGNNKSKDGIQAPIYIFACADGKLSEAPTSELTDDLPPDQVFWSGLVHHPAKPLLFAGSRTTNEIVVFDTNSGARVARIAVEQQPCALVISPDGRNLYCSNWASDSISVVDTQSFKVSRVIGVGDNPNDMVLASDGRLFVCCSNDNTVIVVDTKSGALLETIVTSMYPNAPEGSTPNALALDPEENTLYVANADNYNICVVDVEEADESTVLGFVPTGWYPSAVAVDPAGANLYIGNGKGLASYATPRGPGSPNPESGRGGSVKSLQEGAISIVNIAENRPRLGELTRQAYDNCPYNDSLLVSAKPPAVPSVVPSEVGAGSRIKHVLYIIKENRTYDQVLGDLPQGNGDPNLCLFGREITPNHHALAEQFVLLDNLYCDAEVSRDGHQWSNAAYATDFIEKLWPASYGGFSEAPRSKAMLPASGYLWDQCARKGITYRTFGEFASRPSEDKPMQPLTEDFGALHGHVSPDYLSWGARDIENAAVFIREFDAFEANYDSADPALRLPSFTVMALPEDHTHGASPGKPTPRACVASNDLALGQIVEHVSNSRYWPETAIFVIEDDAQNGPDHVDARRTIGFVISPYCRRGTVDSTLYTTSSMLRTIELLLGLQPMSQYDAAATPMFASLGDTPDPTPYTHLEANVDLSEVNLETAWGAQESLEMDLSTYDRAPMFALNQIIWKNVRGADSDMPLPVHRFLAARADSSTTQEPSNIVE